MADVRRRPQAVASHGTAEVGAAAVGSPRVENNTRNSHSGSPATCDLKMPYPSGEALRGGITLLRTATSPGAEVLKKLAFVAGAASNPATCRVPSQ